MWSAFLDPRNVHSPFFSISASLCSHDVISMLFYVFMSSYSTDQLLWSFIDFGVAHSGYLKILTTDKLPLCF